MNRLIEGDICRCDTAEERIRIMELFKNKYRVHGDTWSERYDDGDYGQYPYLKWDEVDGLLAQDIYNGDDYNHMSVDEFLNKAGFVSTSQGNSIIRHHFI